MALRIQLKNGQVKDYKTWYVLTDEYGSIYLTKCKMKFSGIPHELDGCDHIECAMKSANWWKEQKKEQSKASVFVGLFCIMIGLTEIFGFDWWLGLMFAAISMILGLGDYYQYISEEDSKEYKELIEFKNNGTINGIEAEKI